MISNHADIGAKSERMLTLDPRKIIRDIFNRRGSTKISGKQGGRQDAAESNCIRRRISLIGERLARESKFQGVYFGVADRPGMAHHDSQRMAPGGWGNRVREVR